LQLAEPNTEIIPLPEGTLLEEEIKFQIKLNGTGVLEKGNFSWFLSENNNSKKPWKKLESGVTINEIERVQVSEQDI
jgi:hypothetical protein